MSIKIYVKYVKNNRDFYTTKMNLPTGNLDSRSTEIVMDVFSTIHSKMHKTIIMVTHDISVAEYSERILYIEDGKITEDR